MLCKWDWLIVLGLAAVFVGADIASAGWERLGDDFSKYGNQPINSPCIRFWSGTPYVVWAEGGEILLKYYNGAGWVSLGNSVNTGMAGTGGSDCCLELANGTPFVAWTQTINSSDALLYVKHYNGAQWVLAGDYLNINPNRRGLYPHMTMDQGTPYVAWHEQNAAWYLQVHVKSFNGTNWQSVGSQVNDSTTTSSNAPDIAFYNHTPYVSYHEQNGVKVKYFNGADWQQIGSALFEVHTSVARTNIVFVGSTPYVVWDEANVGDYRLFLAYFNGSDWRRKGSMLPSTYTNGANLAVNQDTLYMVRQAPTPTFKIFTKRLINEDWQDMDPADAVLNVSADKNAKCPDIVFQNDKPYVVWQEENGSGCSVYVKYYLTPTASPTATCSPTATPTLIVTATPTLEKTRSATETATPASTSTTTPTLQPTPKPMRRKTGQAVPNPFFPAKGKKTKILFDDVLPDTTCQIRILNLRGRMVRTLENEKEWDGRDDQGHLCEGGVYVFQVEVGERRISGDVVLIK